MHPLPEVKNASDDVSSLAKKALNKMGGNSDTPAKAASEESDTV
jgi:hypothetical protein